MKIGEIEIPYKIYIELVKKVKELNAVEVISLYLALTEKKGAYKAPCPFHGGTSLGPFVVSTVDNKYPHGAYHCFKCNAGGDAIKFVMDYFSIDFKEAVLKIAQDAKIITNDFQLNVDPPKRYIGQREAYEIKKDKTFIAKVYNAFVEAATLNEEDKKYLMEERHLTEEQIARTGYKTFPDKTIFFLEGDSRIKENQKSFTSLLLKKGIQRNNLIGVPGFFKENKKVTFEPIRNSILIPIRDARGNINEIQIDRKAKITRISGSKYICFTSKGKEKGTSADSAISVIYPDIIKSNKIIITEGIYKAEAIASKMSVIAISVQGVGNYKGIEKELLEIKNRYFKGGVIRPYIAYDSDMIFKISVFLQMKNISDYIMNHVEETEVKYLYWNRKYAKGIDDLIYTYQDNYLKLIAPLEKDEWDKSFLYTVYEIILERGENIEYQEDIILKKGLQIPIRDFQKCIEERLKGI